MNPKYVAWAAVVISGLGLYLYFVEKRCRDKEKEAQAEQGNESNSTETNTEEKVQPELKTNFSASQREALPIFGVPLILENEK